MTADAEIGVFGGSGFYSFLEEARQVSVNTPYGAPSAPLAVGEIGGRRVAFLARHGLRHELPPHRVNYRANLWAMRSLGVRRVFGPCAAGSLQPDIHPGHFVVCDQLIDRTWGRPDTYYDGPNVGHVSFADPYCPELRRIAVATAAAQQLRYRDGGTVVVIQGPRFSTRAESAWFRQAGCHVINMTQYPEAFLARELGLCYSGLALVTDYDTGLEGAPGMEQVEPVTMEAVFAMLARNVDRTRELLAAAIPAIPVERSCGCADAGPGNPIES